MITLKAAKEYVDEDFLAIKQITGKGKGNNTYICTTKSAKYIVRIDPDETTLDRFQKEVWCMSEAQKVGVLVPKVLKIGMKHQSPYMVMSYIEGIDGDDLEKSQQTKIWQKLGQYSREIHNMKTSGYGHTMTSNGIFNGNWHTFVDYNIESLHENDPLIELGILTPEHSQTLRSIFEKLKDRPFNFGLIHNDLSLDNTRLSQDGKVYLLDSVDPNLAFLAIFSRDCRDFGVIYSDFGYRKQPISYLKIAQI
ncbi:aminoglycoside phosphotransferase family protein [Chloroflexi bacterium TSY]|nr:aminoglycoside phosphotransferase family protein [Chloroflexi bacterium TSY]